MANITAAQVKELRDMTDSPMMECKKALVEADGDMQKAVDVLRKMGVAKAVKKAGRDTNEGTVSTFVSEDGKKAGILELFCETDFVGTNPKFTAFAAELAKVVAENQPADVDALKAASMGNETVDEALTEMIHVMGENMNVGRFAAHTIENGAFSQYVHFNGRLAVLVEFAFNNPATAQAPEFKEFGLDVAMQVAAGGCEVTRRDEVPADVVEHERNLYLDQVKDSGKPENIQQKMVEGRLEKFFAETVLTEQKSIKDNKVTINQLASQLSKSLNDEITIVGFDRYTIGE